MLLALLSDIHANLQALDACLAHARAAGAKRFVFLGDLIGYGGDPGGVLDRVTALAADGAIVVRGNHDDLAGDPKDAMAAHAAEAALWTRNQVSSAQAAFLQALPLSIREEDRLYVHADASAPEKWRYVLDAETAERSLKACDARIVFCGHVHQPMLYTLQDNGHALPFTPVAGKATPLLSRRRWHVVLGSVGQPRNKDPAASYTLYNTATTDLMVQRVAYDIAGAASRIRAAGLPQFLADRLFEGR
jgi:diadenosine tetraphosphatase ApaH/serine/threonine PP2A family protein phosphatase